MAKKYCRKFVATKPDQIDNMNIENRQSLEVRKQWALKNYGEQA
jgi:hypothetical protein